MKTVKLGTIEDIRIELTNVYNETKDGLLDANLAQKLVIMLKSAMDIIETTELEQRITKLENDTKNQIK